jgi:hypothetical protein
MCVEIQILSKIQMELGGGVIIRLRLLYPPKFCETRYILPESSGFGMPVFYFIEIGEQISFMK